MLPVVHIKYSDTQPRDPAGSPTGGQWTAGAGSSVAKQFEEEKRYSLLGPQSDTGIAIKSPLKTSPDSAEVMRKFQVKLGEIFDKLPTEMLDPKDLIDTQGGLYREKAISMAKNFDLAKSGSVAVVEYQGRYYLADGHHRAAVAVLAGVGRLKAKVLHT